MTPGKYRVDYSASAKSDLRAIFVYIAHTLKARLTAARQIDRLTRLIPFRSGMKSLKEDTEGQKSENSQWITILYFTQ